MGQQAFVLVCFGCVHSRLLCLVECVCGENSQALFSSSCGFRIWGELSSRSELVAGGKRGEDGGQTSTLSRETAGIAVCVCGLGQEMSSAYTGLCDAISSI